MSPLGIVSAGGAIAVLALAVLWQNERADHAETRGLLTAETLRADTATDTANENAKEVAWLIERAVTAERDKAALDTRFSDIRERQAQEIAALKADKERHLNVANKRPGLYERLHNRSTRQLVRSFYEETCRSANCKVGGEGDDDRGAPPS